VDIRLQTLGLRQILIIFTMAAAEAAMLAAIWDFPKWVLFASMLLQLAAAGSLYFDAQFPQINLGRALFLIFLMANLLIVADAIYVRPLDPRLVPFAEKSRFFDGFVNDDSESFKMICFPFDSENPSSCSIALRYQEALGKFWKPKDFAFDQRPSADFKGISILTGSIIPSRGADRLRQQLLAIGIEPDYRTANASLNLGPNDFAVWIGGKP
jgi:hypothetical protein